MHVTDCCNPSTECRADPHDRPVMALPLPASVIMACMASTASDEKSRLAQAITMAVDSVQTGGGPFGAVIYQGDKRIAEGHNRAIPHCDPTAHAEIVALRNAARRLGHPHLPGCVLYASCQPCPMCLAAALWARVERIVFAAPHTEAQRAGFDDSAFARQLYGQTEPVALPAGFLQQRDVPGASTPFDAWLAREDRSPY